MEKKKIINLVVYITLIIAVASFIYKNNGLSKQLNKKRVELKNSTKKIENSQKEYRKLETEYKKIKEELKTIKTDFLILKKTLHVNNKNSINQLESITNKIGKVILEQEEYKFLEFENVTPTGSIFNIE